MERAEYERMHAVEDRMWWYRGLRALAAQLLARALAGSLAAYARRTPEPRHVRALVQKEIADAAAREG